MSCQTLNDYLSFVTYPLQLRAFNHIMFGMTTKLVIYGIIDLIFFSNDQSKYDMPIGLLQYQIVTMDNSKFIISY
jgi:hypothetical protein